MPARPRAGRRPHSDTLLRQWAHLVTSAERGAAEVWTGCPACDGYNSLDARDQLEAVIRRGGARARRLSSRLEPLDARFRAATTPRPFTPDGAGWWRQRNLD